MTSFFNDVNPRTTTRSPRGIMRVVVVIAMIVGLAGVMGFAPGTGGELRREAAGVMPIVDAGNYVGTELGERLSNNGGMDLSWPRPEGFDGIWFEKEPYGRREHVVWESQRFVGEPVDIPKLKQGQVKGDFVGLPDICGPVVRERMAELGYTDDPALDSNNEIRYSCNYANMDVEHLDRMDVLDFSLGTLPKHPSRFTGETQYELPSDAEFVALEGGSPNSSCFVWGEPLRAASRLHLVTAPNNVDSQYAMCTINSLYWQVFENVTGGF